MGTSTSYTALIIASAVLILSLTACGDSPSRAEFETYQAEIQGDRDQVQAELQASRAQIQAMKKELSEVKGQIAVVEEATLSSSGVPYSIFNPPYMHINAEETIRSQDYWIQVASVADLGAWHYNRAKLYESFLPTIVSWTGSGAHDNVFGPFEIEKAFRRQAALDYDIACELDEQWCHNRED